MFSFASNFGKKNTRGLRVTVFFVWVFAGIIYGSPGSARAESPIAVTVSILPQKYFVEKIGGDRVSVRVMVRPGQNPTLFDPTQRQIAGLAKSRLYFLIGVPFETVWENKIRRANPKMKLVATHQGLTVHDHEPDSHHGHNPHTWLSPVLVKTMAGHIKSALVEADPASSKVYEDNYHRFIAELDGLDQEIRQILSPVEKRHFMVYHPAWEYFAKTYGLTEIPIESEGKEPGPQALAGVIESGRQKGINVIFIQKQFSQKVVHPIARALKAKVVQVDPLSEDYSDNLRKVARTFVEAMQ